jgi:3-oxoacyl-[acyl-carrier protein] reductase
VNPAEFSLAGRSAVIIGAASGIGRETARVFAEADATLMLADVNGDALADLAAEIGNGAQWMRVDVSDRASVDALAARAAAEMPIDAWANLAGIVAPPTSIVDVDEATLDRLIAVNLKGVYWGCAAAARIMSAQGSGSIINASSAGAEIPVQGISVYALTKAAVNMITRSLATEIGPMGVRVNAVAPGFIDTPMVTYRFRKEDGTLDLAARESLFADRAAAAPLRRIGQPRDIALAILYLASEASDFMTGQVLRPNGGTIMP